MEPDYSHLRGSMRMICDPENDYIWRVELHDDGRAKVSYIGFCPIDDDAPKKYDALSDMPEWMQHRIAALYMMPPDPEESAVFGIGRRINDTVYWIVQ